MTSVVGYQSPCPKSPNGGHTSYKMAYKDFGSGPDSCCHCGARLSNAKDVDEEAPKAKPKSEAGA
jgi:hypothetical protein